MLKSYYIKTFGCQMNYADSEKIDMILRSAGLRKVIDPVKADIVIMNTCSVRQKGEDRVFGFMREISRYHKNTSPQPSSKGEGVPKQVLFGITGCMVRQSGLAKRYLPSFVVPMQEGSLSQKGEPKGSLRDDTKKQEYKRKNAEKITFLESSDSLLNYDDELFLRSPLIDFVFRIEEVAFLTKILSLITSEDIGNDAKFNEYLAVKQLQENPSSANVIIQTGCDNFCTFCIVPHTRGRELSRSQDEVVTEIQEVVKNGSKEITLLGQNVNSYGKETRAKLWNSEEMKWIQIPLSRGEDSSVSVMNQGGLVSNISFTSKKHIPYRIDLEEKARELRKNQTPFEKIFWYEILHQEGLKKYKFTRQKPLLDYIVDFYCSELRLVVELDGDQHADNQRTQELGEFGIRVVRYSNQEVLKNKEGIYENFINVIKEQAQNPPLSPLDRGVVTPFRELLEKINSMDGLDRIRFTSSNPHDMTRDILDAHFDLPKMCNYLHFALQSGSDTMLKRMNRKHTYTDFKAQLDYLRSRDPLFSISTDIIVGFPGETEEEFQATATAMRECQFDFAFIARYSSRSGTVATLKYEDDISAEEKARRWSILNDILREIVKERNLLIVGREEEILISGEGKDETWVGRTRNFKEVFIKKEDTHTNTDIVENIKVGDLVKVKIVENDGWVLRGERI